MNEKDKPMDVEALVDLTLENYAKRMAKRKIPDIYFFVTLGSFIERRGPRGGSRGAYVLGWPLHFHLDQVVRVETGRRGTEITFEISNGSEYEVIRAADVEVKSMLDFENFIAQLGADSTAAAGAARNP
jgi:hypothetical protein